MENDGRYPAVRDLLDAADAIQEFREELPGKPVPATLLNRLRQKAAKVRRNG